jgi:hypothetical protein
MNGKVLVPLETVGLAQTSFWQMSNLRLEGADSMVWSNEAPVKHPTAKQFRESSEQLEIAAGKNTKMKGRITLRNRARRLLTGALGKPSAYRWERLLFCGIFKVPVDKGLRMVFI